MKIDPSIAYMVPYHKQNVLQIRYREVQVDYFGKKRHKYAGHDSFQPKTDLFSTRSLISVHFKTVRYFSQSIFSLFSYLKNA